MTLAEINDTQMQALGNRIKMLVLAQLRQQVPARGRNPFATGYLAGRINANMIVWTKNEEGSWELSIDLNASGLPAQAKYTNFGTRNHNEFNLIRDNGIFGLPFEGYSKGGPGVRAQNWTSMTRVESQLRSLVEGQLKVSVEQFLQSTIQSVTNDRV
jgi:hypothetical protein